MARINLDELMPEPDEFRWQGRWYKLPPSLGTENVLAALQVVQRYRAITTDDAESAQDAIRGCTAMLLGYVSQFDYDEGPVPDDAFDRMPPELVMKLIALTTGNETAQSIEQALNEQITARTPVEDDLAAKRAEAGAEPPPTKRPRAKKPAAGRSARR